jgi:hypothetical protein
VWVEGEKGREGDKAPFSENERRYASRFFADQQLRMEQPSVLFSSVRLLSMATDSQRSAGILTRLDANPNVRQTFVTGPASGLRGWVRGSVWYCWMPPTLLVSIAVRDMYNGATSNGRNDSVVVVGVGGGREGERRGEKGTRRGLAKTRDAISLVFC